MCLLSHYPHHVLNRTALLIHYNNWLQLTLRLGLAFGFPQNHFCCHLLVKRWTHILPQPKIIQAKTRRHRKADVISAAETNSVQPEGRNKCRGKCPLGVEATMARSGAFSDSPQHTAGCFKDLLPKDSLSFTFLFFFLVCLLGLLGCIYSQKSLLREQNNSAKVSKVSYLGQDMWTFNMNSKGRGAYVEFRPSS